MINYYETLGVNASASDEEIKGAYRQMAKRYHPDVQGGDPVVFARLGEAYQVLSDTNQRRKFDQMLRAAQERREASSRPATGFRPAPQAPSSGMGPPFTRVMSLTLPSKGRFLMEGMEGKFSVAPTTEKALWETTRRKFGVRDTAALAAQIIQIRLHGPRDLVRRLRPMPTEFGVQFQGAGKQMFMDDGAGGAFMEGGSASAFVNPRPFNPNQLIDGSVTVEVTVPKGVPLYLYDLAGTVTLGDIGGELVATLGGTTILRGGKISGANLNLEGRAKVHVGNLEGQADVIAVDECKLLIGGKMTRLRVILENQAHVEVLGSIETLQATIGGRGFLNVKGEVQFAHCDVRAGGYAKLARVHKEISGSRSGGGQVDVLQPPPPGATPRAGMR